MKKHRLNKKQLCFCYWVAQNYPRIEAYFKAGYRVHNRDIASKNAYKLLQKAEVKQRIEQEIAERFDRSKLTTDYVLGKAQELLNTTSDERIKAQMLSFLAECLAMKKQITESKSDITITDAKDRNEFLRQLYNRGGDGSSSCN